MTPLETPCGSGRGDALPLPSCPLLGWRPRGAETGQDGVAGGRSWLAACILLQSYSRTVQYYCVITACPAADSHHTRHKAAPHAAAVDGLRVEEAAATPLQAPHNEAAGATRGKGRRGRGLLDFVVGHG
jgi:hypothetical protein